MPPSEHRPEMNDLGNPPVWYSKFNLWAEEVETASTGATHLYDLIDTDIPAPVSGDLLQYNSTSSKWVATGPNNHTHPLTHITDAGTAASHNVPSSGNATSEQVVKGNDTRLSDSRTPTTHTHVMANVTDAGTAATKNTGTGSNDVATGNHTHTGTYAPASHTHIMANVTDAGNAATMNTGTTGSTVALGNHTHTTALDDLSNVTAPSPATNDYLKWNGSAWVPAAAAGGGGSGIQPYTALVYKTATNTVAIEQNGTVISDLATTAANNVTVIQAALDHCAGALNLGGHSGGGTCFLSDGEYLISAAIKPPVGVSFRGTGTFDRYNLSGTSAHSFSGSVLRPTAGFSSASYGGTIGSRKAALALGTQSNVPPDQSTINPHGVLIENIAIYGKDLFTDPLGVGILLADTQYVEIRSCHVSSFHEGIGIEVASTETPDDGAHGNRISHCVIGLNKYGIYANGSGATDSYIIGCWIGQNSTKSVYLGSGGWQISSCHMTCANTDQTGTDEGHLHIANAGNMVVGNYFDTTGGYQIVVTTGANNITANHFRASNSSKLAFIHLASSSGLKTIVSSNTGAKGNASAWAFVKLYQTTASLASNNDYRPVVMGNILFDGANGGTGYAVIDSANVQISDVNAGMDTDLTGANPYIQGNRYLVGNI